MSGNNVVNRAVKIPAVMGLRRAMIISDGLFYAAHDAVMGSEGVLETVNEALIPVIRHGIRGTQNQNTGTTDEKSVQVQTTESAKSFHDSRFVRVAFSFRPLSLRKEDIVSTCSGNDHHEFLADLDGFLSRAEGSNGLKEVCHRIARNVFNGRWLWRNRQIGTAITVRADAPDLHGCSQDALKTPLNTFGNYTKSESLLAEKIEQLLFDEIVETVNVDALIDLGFAGSVEVYPSQNFVSDKPKGFARPLYKLDVRSVRWRNGSNGVHDFEDTRITGLAALRDQKIWNAMRTIDTWYGDYESNDRLPIPVEPLGASIASAKVFRNRKNGSLYDMLPRIGSLDPDSENGMFMIANLIRGGVLSGKKNGSDAEDE